MAQTEHFGKFWTLKFYSANTQQKLVSWNVINQSSTIGQYYDKFNQHFLRKKHQYLNEIRKIVSIMNRPRTGFLVKTKLVSTLASVLRELLERDGHYALYLLSCLGYHIYIYILTFLLWSLLCNVLYGDIVVFKNQPKTLTSS